MAQNYCTLSFLTTLESNNYRVSYRLLTSYQHNVCVIPQIPPPFTLAIDPCYLLEKYLSAKTLQLR